MLVLLPIENIHPLTNNSLGKKAALVNLSDAGILSIDEDTETGYATIRYHSNAVVKTFMSFIQLLDILVQQGRVEVSGYAITAVHSKNVKSYFKL
jgi:hypothetical protein